MKSDTSFESFAPFMQNYFCLHMKIMSRLYLIDSIWKMQKINLLEVI